MKNETKIVTLKNGYHVWTRKEGESDIKILLLHGGPGMTHEYLEPFSAFAEKNNIEIIFYDQLGSYNSDQPDDRSLWTIDRYCEEVDEVRAAWNLDNFYLYGQSWGGMLAMEYAVRHGKKLKALINSNMVDDMNDYATYINKYRDSMDKKDVQYMKRIEYKGNFKDVHYNDLLFKLYERCICRITPWPDAVNRTFAHTNEQVYNTLQGPTEFTITGSLKNWSIRSRLNDIAVPTLLLGARYDSMNPKVIMEMANRFQNAEAHICPNGSHFSIFDDQEDYFNTILNFLKKIEKSNK